MRTLRDLTPTQLLDIRKRGAVAFGEHVLNWQAHEAQRQILSTKSKTKVIVAGRRFGKSEMCAVDCLHFAYTNNGSKQFLISASQDQANIIFETIVRFAQESILAPTIEKVGRMLFPEIRFINGSTISARSTSYDGKFIRGHSAHRVIVDEAAFIKRGILGKVIIPMLADYKEFGELILISTPCGRNDFFDAYERGRKHIGGVASWQFPSYANPHISHEFLDTMKKEMLSIAFRTEVMAEFVDDQICVFRWEDINDARDTFEESFEAHPSRQYYMGVDVAKQRDNTAIVVLDGTNPYECKIVYTERFNDKTYAFVVERVLAIAQQFHPLRILVDESGVGVAPTETICSILPQAEGFTFSMPSKISLINTLKLGLEKKRIKFSGSNTALDQELRYYEYEFIEATGNIKMHAQLGKFDDCVIALALAYQTVAIPYEIEVVGVERPYDDKMPMKERRSLIDYKKEDFWQVV